MEATHDRKKLEELLQSSDIAAATETLMYICFNIDDADWVQDKCVEIIERRGDLNLIKLAITCIGHVARIHSFINKAKVMPVLERCLKDPALSGRAEDALQDIEIFIK
ncbi:hypothetical protein QZM18_31220 [Burkholderia diffusa]|uniref:hypothetical protein n=1 Tax=Burkholderia diffusa TaxID=488732 RepID=UPI002651A7E1|nr:hypothetical protein [Burkholderia diffusa]MDN7908561.1 hypothetical protein [Burkholderia diffusa]